MGTDNSNKVPLNYRVAQVVLHCNNVITLVLALITLGVGAFHQVGTASSAKIKFSVCDTMSAALKSEMVRQMVQENATAAPVEFCSRATSTRAVTGQSSQGKGGGHCDSHNDCPQGHYCDEDFACWDCDFICNYGPAPGKDCGTEGANKCDAFDLDAALDEGRYPCQRCMDAETNPIDRRGLDKTMVQDVAAPEGAIFIGSSARVMIWLGAIVAFNSMFGFLGDAFERRELLFIHHFILLLLAISMIYTVIFSFVFQGYAKVLLRSYWPWIKESFPQSAMRKAQGSLEEWLTFGATLGGLLAMSLWSGVIASARLLGLKMLAKQMLILTNLLSVCFGLATSIAAIVSLTNGYPWDIVGGIAAMGVLSGGLGVWGFVGAYTERTGLLKAQMCCTVPATLAILLLALEAVFWDKADLKGKFSHLGRRMNGEFGLVSDEQAALMLQSHLVLMGLLTLMMGLLILLNLCCTRVLIQRISLDGRGYGLVANEDIDDDYGDGGDTERGAQRRRQHTGGQSFQMDNFDAQFQIGGTSSEEEPAAGSGNLGMVQLEDSDSTRP